MKVRTYFGVIIHPAAPNSSGMRWWAFANQRMVRADTLEGIKALIRKYR